MTELSCDWCGNSGHTAAAHPLPADHPHYDPALDDNPLLDLALNDFLGWQEEQTAPKKSIPATAARSPMAMLLDAGPEQGCNQLVHWWAAVNVKAGEPCMCGKTTKS